MKKLLRPLFLFVLMTGFILNCFSQETLPGITVVSLNYKYLKSVSDTSAGQPVNLLQRRAATFNVKESTFYEDDYENYFVSFYIPDGQVLAVYDQKGKLIRTAEKFKNVILPQEVQQAIATRFPQWKISKDVYLVSYSDDQGAKKVYKLLLENGDKRMRVKTNDKGEFL